MHINEQYHDLPILNEQTYTFISRDGEIFSKTEEILEEHVMDIYVNDILTMKVICMPENLTELTLGRLLTEGIIASMDDIRHIYICEYGKRARVYLQDDPDWQKIHETSSYTEITPTCCTGNHILNDYFVTHNDAAPVTPISWKPEWIFHLADRFATGMPVHEKTWATHSCLLAKGDHILYVCEDIGRHNALDKVIGYALRNDIDLTKCIVYASGRIPTDMVMKAIRAGIPILASKGSSTVEAIELAREYDLTLIGAARRDRMKLLAGNMPSDHVPD